MRRPTKDWLTLAMNKTPFEMKSRKGQTELKLKKVSNKPLMSSGENNVEFEVLHTPVKSDSDKKEYKFICNYEQRSSLKSILILLG